jgi:uncharacterized protein (TIGR02246 family)
MKSLSMLMLAPLAAGITLAASASPAMPKAKASTCHRMTAAQADAQFNTFNAAWATKDPTKVTALFDDDAVLLATVANVPRTDSAGINDYFVKFLRGSPVGTINSTTIKSGCNWLLRMGTWTVTLTDPVTGAKNDVKARYTFLYQFEDGKWKIEHLHSSAMPEK